MIPRASCIAAAAAATLLVAAGGCASRSPAAPGRQTVNDPGKHGPGEPGTQAETPNADENFRQRYEETPGAHAERPGKHSTTVGRHGTSGEAGGGVNTQSGAGVAPTDNPVLQDRQKEEDDAERAPR